ncbi:MAG: D-alanyl-D-alanine carboxypeptidase (penicillin-binding protein 5/6) [Candidatus Kentron sp. G]|nr:MAG: D-alanyl-D-alanine carboxypeptidase (penicillin-binding protein 5/6) [Candidatus Kentron sp. G]VFM99063.1 MAG: D-alanyl-D-alanine carboxypeptidase (penicillin-binding protein 5/6) [Candidatus Kentron sp. G]VFN01437.1 MAG: D-alanyl-D-alanine carboxypeptidase (penicillin-binding protein 5/6) [Candidatus Kentron sp. G]
MYKHSPTHGSIPLPFQTKGNLCVSALFVLTILYFTISAAAAGPLPHPSPPNIKANGYLLVDSHSGTVLAEQNADERMTPASLTKMMTAYVVFSELRAGNLALGEEVIISEKAWRTPGSRTFVEVDTRVPVEVLLKGIIIQSGNDASVALAEHIAGDEPAFAQRMNQAAKRLGLTGSHFVNSTGLPEMNHYTTARDMATLGIALVRHFPELYKLHAIKSYEHNSIKQFNRNKLLWRDDSVDGIKTGYTEAAGYCLVASARQENMRLMSVVMGADSVNSRTQAAQTLLRYGFRFFETSRLYGGGNIIQTVPVWKGSTDMLDVGVEEDLYMTVPTGQQDSIKADMQINTLITAPVNEGDICGKIRVQLDGKTLLERPVVALHSVPEGGMWKRALDAVRLYFY